MMDSLSSKCIEDANSTDCLLRTIINFLEDTKKGNDAKFEWDPITFGFTVSIALVAAGLAFITIMQSVLATGPGRRKSNSEAIGKWSKYTKRKWQLWDLGYLHVAKTPILTLDKVKAHLYRELSAQEAKRFKKLFDDPPQEAPGHSVSHSQSLTAGAAKWLVFINEVGLSHLELSDWALETWLADYLPGDLLAVPALIELRFIYIFMSFFYKPFRVLKTDSKYPVLMGTDFHFEVRQHPILGSVATFSKHHKDFQKTWRGRMTPKKLSLMAEQAFGLVPVSTAPRSMKGDTPKERDMQAEELIRLRDADVVDDINLSDQTRLSWATFHGHWSFCTFREAAHKYDRGRDSSFTPLSPSSATLFALMFADIPKAIPEIFPCGKLDFRGTFEALSISADITLENNLERTQNSHHILGLVFSSKEYKYGKCPIQWPLPNPLGTSTCRCQQIVRACKGMIQTRDTPDPGTHSMSAEELLRFRSDVINFLLVVESWLRRQCLQREVRCAKFSLASETIQLQHIANFLDSNKPLSLGLSLFDFLQIYRDYIESGTDDEFMWKMQDEGEDNPEEFRKLLRALVKANGIDETLIEDLKENPSLGGLIPTSAVWLRKPSNDQTVSLDVSDLTCFGLADTNIAVDVERRLNYPEYDHTAVTQSDNCLIRRVLGWRVLFLTIIYMTAVDNTDMLSSRSWYQILPML